MKQRLIGGLNDIYRQRYAQLLAKRYGTVTSSTKVIAIVGANGKTTTAKYIRELFAENNQTCALLELGDHDSFGVKRVQTFLRQAKKDNMEYAVLTLNAHDIRCHVLGSIPLEAIVVTNTSKRILASILSLLESRPRFIVVNRDDEHYGELAQMDAAAQTISYGKHDESEAQMTRTKLYKKGSELQLTIDHQTKLKLATYLIGDANLYNLAAAVTTLYVMGENILHVDEGAARLEEQSANYEYIAASTPYHVVLDFAPDEMALSTVVATAKELSGRRLIVAIQADTTTDRHVNELADIVDRLIVVDVNDEQPTRGTLERVVSPDAAIKLALRAARQGDTVLFAGPVFARQEEDGRSYAHVTVENTLRG